MIVYFFTRPGRREQRYLYCRLTYKGQSAEFKLNYVVTPVDTQIGTYKAQVMQDLMDLFNLRLIRNLTTDPQIIKQLYLNKTQERYLLQLYEEFLEKKIKPKVTKDDLGKATLEKFMCVYEHLKDFLNSRGKSDINLLLVTPAFIEEFDDFLRQFNGHNTAMKNLYRLKAVTTYALKVKRYITEDPFVGKPLTLKKVSPVYLTETELKMLIAKTMAVQRLEQVKDLFLFQCFTGLAYADMRNLKAEWIDQMIIKTNRQKSGEPTLAFMYQTARNILEKYHYKLPIVSNQKMNAYLKEIADICCISKKLTTHVARHTYATTINLKNGVSLQTVQKLLGHATIKQTEHYARLDEHDVRLTCKKASKKVNKLYNSSAQLQFFDTQIPVNGKEENQ